MKTDSQRLVEHIEGFTPPLTLDYMLELDRLYEAELPEKIAAGHFTGKGKINAYQCEGCRGIVVCRDRDEGVTPFMVGCRESTVGGNPGGPPLHCGQKMQSMFYRLAPEPKPGSQFGPEWSVSHEWIRPKTQAELDEALHYDDEYLQYTEHLSRGGLHLIRLEDVETQMQIAHRLRDEQIEQLSRFVPPAYPVRNLTPSELQSMKENPEKWIGDKIPTDRERRTDFNPRRFA